MAQKSTSHWDQEGIHFPEEYEASRAQTDHVKDSLNIVSKVVSQLDMGGEVTYHLTLRFQRTFQTKETEMAGKFEKEEMIVW